MRGYTIRALIKTGVRATVLGVFIIMLQTGYAQQQGSAAIRPKPIQQVSQLSGNNQNPAIAYSADGHTLAAVWDGLVNGKRRILFRERLNSQWLPPVIVDDNPVGKNESPSVQIDANGTPHIAWVQERAGRKVPVYARRLSRSPNKWHYQAIPFPADSTTIGNCDLVRLKLRENNSPWLVWQFGYGSVYSVACSHYNSNGTFQTDEITPGSTGHNLEPKLFFTPNPTVYWYVSQSDQFYLLGSTYNLASREWQLAPPDDLDALPGDNLPEMFQYNSETLAAIWYEQANPLNPNQSTDHVLIGIQNPETKGRGEVIDQQVGTDFHSVTGTKSHANLVVAWVSESYTNGSQVYIGIGPVPEKITPIQVSPDTTIQNTNPVVATSNSQTVTVAWEQENLAGETQIVIRDITIK